MTKYKLIRKYSNSPEVGTIITLVDGIAMVEAKSDKPSYMITIKMDENLGNVDYWGEDTGYMTADNELIFKGDSLHQLVGMTLEDRVVDFSMIKRLNEGSLDNKLYLNLEAGKVALKVKLRKLGYIKNAEMELNGTSIYIDKIELIDSKDNILGSCFTPYIKTEEGKMFHIMDYNLKNKEQ